MKRIPFALFSLVCLVSLVGCQCCGVTERYADLIDDVTDYDLELDAWYHPGLDLTRIGKPDWCRYRWNGIWCKRACCTSYCGEPTACPPCSFCLEDEPTIYDVEPTPGNPKLPPTPKSPAAPPAPKQAASAY